MKKINIILLIIGMILCSSMPCKAENELGYAVYHLCQKMLAEPSTAKDIDNVLHKPVGYGIPPRGFEELKPAELNLLVEQYKQTDFLQDYYDNMCFFAFKYKLDYNELEIFVKETDNITSVYDIQSTLSSFTDEHIKMIKRIVRENLEEGINPKALSLEAPQWYVDDYKDVIDTLVSRTDLNLKDVKLNYTTSDKYTSEKIEELMGGIIAYFDHNLPIFYSNFLYHFFPQKEKMDFIRCGLKVKVFDSFCSETKENMKYIISKAFYDWCKKDNRIKKAKRTVKEQGLVADAYTPEWRSPRYYYSYMGQVELPTGDYDEAPSYIGGVKALNKYIRTHLKYPTIAYNNHITSTIYVGFDVDTDGSISNAEIICNDSEEDFELKMEELISGKALDSKRVQNVKKSLEALESYTLKVVNGMKKINPAKKNGEPIKCRFCIPTRFIGNNSKIKNMVQSVKNIDKITIYK